MGKNETPQSYLGLPPGAINEATAERLRKVIREVWHQRSWQKRAALARATDGEGFLWCEQCRQKVPKVHVDHIVKVDQPDASFLQRLFIEPGELQVLCVGCHALKTWGERLDLFAFAARPSRRRGKKGL